MRRVHSTVITVRLGNISLTRDYACDREYFDSSSPEHTLVGKERFKEINKNLIEFSIGWMVKKVDIFHFLWNLKRKIQ